MDTKAAPTPRKRGPKPIGGAPMTAAERKRRSRARQVLEGTRAEFMISLSGETLKFVSQMAESNGVSRAAVVQEFLDMAIHIVQSTVTKADRMLTDGASMDEVQSVMRQAFSAPIAPAEEAQQEAPRTK